MPWRWLRQVARECTDSNARVSSLRVAPVRHATAHGWTSVALALSLAAACASPHESAPTNAGEKAARFEPLNNEDAWERFERETPPLPLWARMMAESLPRTTALQLDLDHLHRAKNPLGPVLAGRLRWEVADANQCAYAKESIEADLGRAGLTAAQLADLGDTEELSEAERVAHDFARKLTRSASELTDDEVANLIEHFGPDDAVAIVHTVAHANFQQRVFLGLGLETEPGGPCPPREVRLPSDAKLTAPERAPATTAASLDTSQQVARVGWRQRGTDELRDLLEQQKVRAPRIAPADPIRLARLPRPDRTRVAGSNWGKVSMGYQPVLTSAWFQTMGAFSAEARLDDVFANTLFWVITRANDCFY